MSGAKRVKSRCSRLFQTVLAMAAITCLFGCVKPIPVEALLVMDLVAPQTNEETLRVKSAGGRWSMTEPEGSDVNFLEALHRSLEATNAFRAVVKSGETDLLLDVFILEIDMPPIAADCRVVVRSRWTVLDTATGEQLHQEIMRSSYTATMGDALVGATRYRLANEGAVRANIREGLEWLTSLEF